MTASTPPMSPIGDGSSTRDLTMPRRAFQTAAPTARTATGAGLELTLQALSVTPRFAPADRQPRNALRVAFYAQKRIFATV
jgi:hypothetical protein